VSFRSRVELGSRNASASSKRLLDAVTAAARAAAQQDWLWSVTELVGERLPALSIACTLTVFDVCVPYLIQRSTPIPAPSKTPFTCTS
jgi:hypothetical protein